jgi:DNA-binding GntR family transcriptional regulator
VTDTTAAEPSLVVRMRDAVLSGELAPGQRLVESELTGRFHSTRGAVREALVHLEGEGLVEREHNRGARVRRITLAEAIEITEARAALEGLCAAKAATLATDAERDQLRAIGERMRSAVDAGDVVAYSGLAQEVHAAVRVIARQRTAADLLERLRYQSVRFHFSVALLPGRPATGLREHLEVIDAIVSGSAEDAERIMRAHLESVIDALTALGQQPTPLVLGSDPLPH